MFYIHQISCSSLQQIFSHIDPEELTDPIDNKFFSIDSEHNEIPVNLLRRMGKAIKLGISIGLPLLKQTSIDGIIIGTGNGGLEDCIRFLNQIIDYGEGKLTPTNFIQSTTNAIAAQLGSMNANKGYNITHVHRGLAFENAIIDTYMLLKENPSHTYLLGGVDEISDYNYNIEFLAGSYKKEIIRSKDLYLSNSDGTIAGEGAAMFITNNISVGSCAMVRAIKIIHTNDLSRITSTLDLFLQEFLPAGDSLDLFLSGENGDFRLLPFYLACEKLLEKKTSVARFKHMVGEFQSVSSMALYIACYGIQFSKLPEHMYKKKESESFNNILLYNTYKGMQHSFILISKT